MTANAVQVDLGGPVNVIDYGGEGPTVVLVHGLGGSIVNWRDVAPRLAERARVHAVDLAGFGRTRPAGRSTTVGANQRLLDRFLVEVVGTPALLVGNSMGGLISLLETAAHPERVAGLVLIDPALPRARGAKLDRTVAKAFAAYAIPGLGERLLARRRATLGPEGLVRETLALCCVDPSRVSPELVAESVALVRERMSFARADVAYIRAARSILRVLGKRARYFGMIAEVEVPTLLLHGRHDRLVPVQSARAVARIRPDWTYVEFDDLGHVPQIEDPRRTAAAILEWLAGPGASAAAAATASGLPAGRSS
ncbi:MAG: alpha/beta hydrolase [Actinomycetota bacterium]|nr:alpha/beta hydrolase [Actinomycetota bacterium]